MPQRIRRGSKISNGRLAKLYFSEGLSISAIAAKVHIGSRTLYGRVRRLGFKLRSRAEAQALRQRKNLDNERAKLRKVLLRWNLSPNDCLFSDTEIDSMMDRVDEIGRELKTLVAPPLKQDAPIRNTL
jgi:hypothetical protein